MLKKALKIAGIFCFLLLAGCAQQHPPKGAKHFSVQPPAQRQAELRQLKFWRINDGEVSIQEVNVKPSIATFYWSQMKTAYSIQITSMLSLYRLEIYKSFGQVQLWKNGTHVFNAKTPEKLIQKAVGWSLPISNLQYWIKGIPAPQKTGSFKVKYDQYGHLSELKQQGWIISYSAYKNFSGIDLPQVILLVRPGITIKIFARDWILTAKPEEGLEAIG